MTTETTKLQELKNKLQENKVFNSNIQFPITHIVGGLFVSQCGKEFTLNESSIDSFRKLTRYKYTDENDNDKIKYSYHYSYSDLKEAFVNKDWYVFEQCTKHQSAIERTKNRMVCTFYNNELIGIFKNYNFVTHEYLVNMLLGKGLTDRINDAELEPNYLKIGLRIDDKLEDDETELHYKLILLNRIDGWRGIEYFVQFKMNEVEFKYNFEFNKKRHLKNVGDLIESLKVTVSNISQYNFKKTLNETSGNKWILEIEQEFINKGDKYVNFITQVNNVLNKIMFGKYNCYQLMGVITQLGSLHGNKMITTEITEWFIKSLFKI